MNSPINQSYLINPEQEQRIKHITYAKLEALNDQIKHLERLELFEQPSSPNFFGFNSSPDNFPSPHNSFNHTFNINKQSPGYMQQGAIHNIIQHGAMYNLSQQTAMHNFNLTQQPDTQIQTSTPTTTPTPLIRICICNN